MKTLIKLGFWMAILTIALSGCSKTDDPTVDNGDNTDNPANPTDTTSVYKSSFKKKVFNSPEEIQAFIPPAPRSVIINCANARRKLLLPSY